LREIQVAGAADLLWKLLRLLDGARTTEEVLADVPAQLRNPGARLLAALAAAGGLDLSGHPFRRFAHAGTKRGVLPVGELDADQIRRLATDGSYRRYPEVPRLAVPKEIPERLAAFYALTRARRSFRDFNGVPLARSELEALLTTACGVTGIVRWGDRELPLRAYPSGGALYPVEIYPVVFAVDGLDPGVYHYFAAEDALEVVRAGVDSQLFVDAALPPERGMLSGAAVLVCLSAVFDRSERKYGEGVYRVIAAEAGHISENLLLAATALGLHGRPWGGIFDDLLNALLGFDPEREQFLLGVLVGHADGRRSEGPYRPVP
jgi:SagB-type dehydrogenase family enzyme